jgi:hypothetical protein
MLIQFLVRDEPELGGWQSGLFTAGGAPKPSLRAFELPLAEVSRRGELVTLWGQVRPGSGHRSYVIQRRRGNRWLAAGPMRRTGDGGTLQTTVAAPPGSEFRIVAPGVGVTGPPLVLS